MKTLTFCLLSLATAAHAAEAPVAVVDFGPRVGNHGAPKLLAGDATLYFVTRAPKARPKTAFTGFVLSGKLRLVHWFDTAPGHVVHCTPGAEGRHAADFDGASLVLEQPVAEGKHGRPVSTNPDLVKPLLVADGKGTARIVMDREHARDTTVAVIVLRFEPGASVPEHQHDGSWELLYVQGGAGTLVAGEQTLEVKKHQAIAIPPGLKHRFTVTSAEGFDAVQFYTPPGPEQRFKAPPPK